MDFGIFNLMQQRHRAKTSRQVLDEALALTRAAEDLDFTTTWFAEHHFSNYSLCPSPLVMAAHAAGVTERLRLGTAVVVPALYMPARLLAEIAMVDTLSNGRLELGIGSGYQAFEFERFGVDLATAKDATFEMLDMIEMGLTQPNFTYQGNTYHQPSTAINVRPVQTPLPPIWLAGADPRLHRRAARDGHGVFISGALGGGDKLVTARQRITDAYVEEGRDPEDLRLGVLRFVFVSDDKKEAEHYLDCARYQQRLTNSLRNRTATFTDDYMVAEEPFEGEPSLDDIADNLIVGDVETCIERAAQELTEVRPDHMAIYFQVGDMELKPVLGSMERWMGEVVPGIEKALGRPIADIGGGGP